MRTNATVTIQRSGVTYDQSTGSRKKGTGETVMTDVPCFLSNKAGTRIVYGNGKREYVNALFPLQIPTEEGPITIGDVAIVTINGSEDTFTVSDAQFVRGMGISYWNCRVERIKTP